MRRFFTKDDANFSVLNPDTDVLEPVLFISSANRMIEERSSKFKLRYDLLRSTFTTLGAPTHELLIIAGPDPIEPPDSLEKLVKDLANWQDQNIGCIVQYKGCKPDGLGDLFERAKKLVGPK